MGTTTANTANIARSANAASGTSARLLAAADSRARGREQKFGLDHAHDDTNQRVWNVLSRGPVFADLVEHPVALRLLRSVVGWPMLLGNLFARPIYRTQENWFLALDPSVRQFASDDLLVLLGHRTAGLGLVDGASPA